VDRQLDPHGYRILLPARQLNQRRLTRLFGKEEGKGREFKNGAAELRPQRGLFYASSQTREAYL